MEKIVVFVTLLTLSLSNANREFYYGRYSKQQNYQSYQPIYYYLPNNFNNHVRQASIGQNYPTLNMFMQAPQVQRMTKTGQKSLPGESSNMNVKFGKDGRPSRFKKPSFVAPGQRFLG
ncbi:UNVERIFIED_CONTAM: hypothetical protein RMT77_005748 [Armadillidium vulgare]